MKALQYYIDCFSKLNVNRSGGFPSPHKPVMLLAVLALADGGMLPENKVRYEPGLLDIFQSFFDAVKRPGGACNPYFPFFHLKSEPFWHLKSKKGNEQALGAMTTVRGHYMVTENIDYAYIDDTLYNFILSNQEREILRKSLIDTWFSVELDKIDSVTKLENDIVTYQQVLEGGVSAAIRERAPAPADGIRDPAFARIVKKAYDYRCAASGWRVLLPDGRAMVQAAHLMPYAECKDDDPRNGIALTPTYHWALDRHIIAPGPDLKWHVSPALDRRNRDYRELREIDKQSILLPSKKKYFPRKDCLEYRMDRLVKP